MAKKPVPKPIDKETAAPAEAGPVAAEEKEKIEDGGAVRVEEDSDSHSSIREVEAGPVALPDHSYSTRPPHRDWVAAYLAGGLLVLLFFTILIHYTLTAAVAYYAEPATFEKHYKPIEHIFNTILPILSGLVGSAVTYYFTRDAKSAT